jgi:hypothetical protein
MNVGSELEKLNELKKSGVLSDAEFATAKTKLLQSLGPENTVGSGVHLMGKAANKYVNFSMISAVVGAVLFAIIFFTFFLPRFLKMEAEGDAFRSKVQSEINKHTEKMDDMSKEFDKDFAETKKRIEQTRKEIDEAHRKSGFK